MQKWIFNNEIDLYSSSLITTQYAGRFYCNGEWYQSLYIQSHVLSNSFLRFIDISDNTYYVYRYSANKQSLYWVDNNYRTIIFDETDEANLSSNFLTFVQNNATQVSFYDGIKYQDIYTDNETLRQQYIEYFNANNYTAAFNMLNNSQLSGKYLSATNLNNLTNKIVELENNDEEWDKFFAYTQTTQPATISSGQMWWQIET